MTVASCNQVDRASHLSCPQRDLSPSRITKSRFFDSNVLVGERDLMIGATVVATDHRIATRHERSFPKIPGLKVQRL